MKFYISIFIIASTLSAITAFGDTAGSVEFSVRTKPIAGKYAPKHVAVIWVTDSEGGFIKTLAVYGTKQKKRLKTWAQQSQKNTADAITGATLKKFQTHTVTWDCCDATGTLVPDGDYRFHVEFTTTNKNGKTTPPAHIQFKKGSKAVSLTPKELPAFDLMKLKYTPAAKKSNK